MPLNSYSQSYLFLRHLFSDLRYVDYACELKPGQSIHDLVNEGMVKLIAGEETCRIVSRLVDLFKAEVETPAMQCSSVHCMVMRFPDQSVLYLKKKNHPGLGHSLMVRDIVTTGVNHEGIVVTDHIEMNLNHEQIRWVKRTREWFRKMVRLGFEPVKF